jgi:hypothetical protein
LLRKRLQGVLERSYHAGHEGRAELRGGRRLLLGGAAWFGAAPERHCERAAHRAQRCQPRSLAGCERAGRPEGKQHTQLLQHLLSHVT